METDFEKTVKKFTVDESIKMAQDSHLPWAHKLAEEILILQIRLFRQANASSSKPKYYEDLQ